jgi:hypothetical protein
MAFSAETSSAVMVSSAAKGLAVTAVTGWAAMTVAMTAVETGLAVTAVAVMTAAVATIAAFPVSCQAVFYRCFRFYR